MMNKEIAIVLDVETAGGFKSPLVYDLGILAIERTTGRVIESHSLVIYDVFIGMRAAMESAYYADKIPEYQRGLHTGEFRLVKFWTAWRILRQMVEKYSVKRVYAYNATFDQNALNCTMRTLTDGKYKHFMPKGIKVCCLWHMACQTILRQKNYRKYALAHGLVSDYGNIRTSAEAAYGYAIGDPNYQEPHTGLADTLIEAELLHLIIRQHKRMDESPKWNCWKIPQAPSGNLQTAMF